MSMIFPPLASMAEILNRIHNPVHEWGSVNRSDFTTAGKLANSVSANTKRQNELKLLRSDEFISVDAAAKELGMDAEGYRGLAMKGQALLVSIDADETNAREEFVPRWATLRPISGEPSVNTLVLRIARDYASYQGGSTIVDFCRFMDQKEVSFRMGDLNRNLSEQGPLREVFGILSQSPELPHISDASLGLKLSDAVSLAKGGPDSMIYTTVLVSARRAMGMNADVAGSLPALRA